MQRDERLPRPQKKSASPPTPLPARRAEAHLPTDGELRRLAERILRLSDADETEVEIDAGADALTRFANNTIHQNVAERNLSVSVRTVFDGRTARATTNKTDETRLRRVVAASATLARSQPKHPDLLPMLGPQKYPRVTRYFPETAEATPKDRARAVARAIGVAAAARSNRRGHIHHGRFGDGAGEFQGIVRGASADARRIFGHHDGTAIPPAGPRPIRPTSSASIRRSWRASASRKAAASRAPREVEPGRWTVILEPAAVLDLVGFLFYDFAGTAIRDQRSCFNKRMGKKVMGDNITVHDDVTHPLAIGRAVRRRRPAAPEGFADRAGRAAQSGLCARHAQKK